jgi:hypothetical protein
MNVHVILRWDWEVESKMDSDFTILGIFSDKETAQFHLDEFQRDALIRQVTGSFYWIETHEVDRVLTGERNV